MTPNGKRLSLKNCLESVHFSHFLRFHRNLFILLIFHKDALNGIAFGWKNWYFPPKAMYKLYLENP